MNREMLMRLTKRMRLWTLGVCAVAFALAVGAFAPASAYADAPTLESVRAAIQALSADPSSYKASDRAYVESLLADFASLSADDQATLEAECSHTGTGQPLARVLESALWAVWSYIEVDNSTTLPDQTYDATTSPALSSEYSKGRSTSSRQKPWSVKDVRVVDGQAYATITVKSDTYTGLWKGGVVYPRGNASGNCEFYDIPIDLNSTFYFAGISSSMSTPISFSLTTTIEEPEIPDESFIGFSIVNAADGLTATRADVALEDDGSGVLTIDLSGASVGYLFIGTLSDALAVSDDLSAWIVGEPQEDGAVRFAIPTAFNISYMPFSVVGSADSDDVANNLRPYQFEIDLGAQTLTLERYDNVFNVGVEVSDDVAPDFTASQTATVRAIGNPNDDTFKCAVTLYMDDDAYDYVEYESLIEGKVATAGAPLSGGTFLLVFENSAGNRSFSLGEPIDLRVHHVESDLWLDRTLTIDLAAGMLFIGGTDDSIAVVKALIEALERDPISIRGDSNGAIARATAAYEALPAAAQQQLDEEKPPSSSVTYGRILENAQWAVSAMLPTDASTTLPDGVYTTGIVSSSGYGKSQSSRSKAFKVKSVTVAPAALSNY